MSKDWKLKKEEPDKILLFLLQELADRELEVLDAIVASEPTHVFSERFQQWFIRFLQKDKT